MPKAYQPWQTRISLTERQRDEIERMARETQKSYAQVVGKLVDYALDHVTLHPTEIVVRCEMVFDGEEAYSDETPRNH